MPDWPSHQCVFKNSARELFWRCFVTSFRLTSTRQSAACLFCSNPEETAAPGVSHESWCTQAAPVAFSWHLCGLGLLAWMESSLAPLKVQLLSSDSLLYNYRIRLFTVQALSHVQLFVTPQTVAHQAPLSMVFSTQVYWSGLPFPSLGDLPDPGSNPHLLHVSCVAGGFLLPSYLGSPLLFSKREQFFSRYWKC